MKLVGNIALPSFVRSSVRPSIRSSAFFVHAISEEMGMLGFWNLMYVFLMKNKADSYIVRHICTFRVMALWKRSGPSCSKLTMSLVNDSLKFTSSDKQICWNFWLKKIWIASHIFSAKNIRILYFESAKTVNEMTLNELVKLTMLYSTGPRLIHVNKFSLKFTSSDTQICWNFLWKKMWVALQKLLTFFFQQKISEYCILNPLKQLTKWPLTCSLS